MLTRHRAFTILELLTAVAIIGVLAALLTPVFASARESARRTACASSLRQLGQAMWLYMDDFGGVLPDRRDLKTALPGGYRPWSGWPPSDPRSGWAAHLLDPWGAGADLWACRSVAGNRLGQQPQVWQIIGAGNARAYYWMWRFDRADDPVALDNLWGKTAEQAVADLQAARNPLVGIPEGVSQVELAVDPYFPVSAPGVPETVRGLSVHFGGRNRLFLDGHVKYLRDGRLR
jgi:prepilin-type N-terminal cleavage/methylation domain-containing protein/prepilin-type processing-associated H-X9-DG protein